MINSKLEQFAQDEAMFQEVKGAILNRINPYDVFEGNLSDELLGEKVRGVLTARKLIEDAFKSIARLREPKQEIGNKENPAV